MGGTMIMGPRPDHWDNRKIGASSPPLETEAGWLLLCHGIYDPGTIYRTGAVLLDRDDPTRVLARTKNPILEPQMPWELHGLVGNVVFPCGAVVRGDTLFVYYGGADAVVAVATTSLSDLLEGLTSGRL